MDFLLRHLFASVMNKLISVFMVRALTDCSSSHVHRGLL